MDNLIGFLFFISFVSLIVGLISPNKFKKIFKNKEVTRKFILKVFGTATAVLFFSIGVFADAEQKVNLDFSQPRKNIKTEIVTTTELKNVSTTVENITTTTVTSNPAVTTNNEVKANPIVVSSQPVNIQPQTTTSSQPAQIQNTSTVYYSISSVVDGDTVKINVNGTIETFRLIGMDTPEVVDPRKTVQCFGKEASNKAKELLTGKKVRIEKDATQGELDKYGRHLAYIYREDGLFYNKYMIEQGYAHEYTYNTPYKYQAEFKAAQKSAEQNQRGLWSPNTCNGNTTQSVTTTTTAPAPTSSQVTTNASTNTQTGKFYTSSYYSSKYYYPESCDGWKSLSTKYLTSFDSLASLLSKYPNRVISPAC